MNSTLLRALLALTAIWRTVDATEATEATKINQLEKGLIFNTRHEKLDDINGEDGKTRCANPLCLIACPAYSSDDLEFNKEISIGKIGIFQKKLYKISDPIENIVAEVCEKFYRPAILYNVATKSYETGYELYFKEGDVDLNYRKYNYDDFKLITEAPYYMKNPPKAESSGVKPVFQISDYEFLVFYWIPVLSLRFNPSAHQIRVKFTSDMINDYYDRADTKCYDYDLGEILYQSDWAKNVNFYSSKQNIGDLFQSILIQPNENWKGKKSPSNYQPMLYSGELERAHIVPLMYLHTMAGKLASCTFLNTFQVWSSILHGQLKLIDRYLYTLYRMYSPKMNVIFGVSGITKVYVNESWKLSKGKYEESNDGPYEISMPKLIYRVLAYETPEDTFYAIIVIHNDLTVSKKDKICKSVSNDWSILENNDPMKGMSYVCSFLPMVNEQLGIYDESPRFPKALNVSSMDLKIVGNRLSYRNETENVIRKLKELFPDQELSGTDTYLGVNSNQDESSSEETPQPKPSQPEPSQPKLKYVPKPILEPEPVYEWREDGKFWLDF